MRGKAGQPSKRIDGAGITPAYAGKSSRLPFIPTSFQDHPRLCGEKQECCGVGSLPRGSPPPMRGKGVFYVLHKKAYRITPAYAGKSVNRFAVHLNSQDHPRLCGEKHLQGWNGFE